MLKLKKFLNNITEICVFQLECGSVKNKEHYQGAFTLVGPRVSKKKLLQQFQQIFNLKQCVTFSLENQKRINIFPTIKFQLN